MDEMTRLIVTADDYGMSGSYDEGILIAARAGAIDAVSAFSTRPGLRPGPLLDAGLEIGLHLDLGEGYEARPAGPEERRRAELATELQFREFIEAFGRPPAYLDGHHHCHARRGIDAAIADFAAARRLPLRSINPRHRRLLRARGALSQDLLIGRLAEDETPLPIELSPQGAARLGGDLVVEWMVHPGRPDPAARSAYDAGRAEDLKLLLSWQPPPGLSRGSHASTLAGRGAD